eukprot:794493-Alexandrium_andersonii.AAC.1
MTRGQSPAPPPLPHDSAPRVFSPSQHLGGVGPWAGIVPRRTEDPSRSSDGRPCSARLSHL